MNQNELCVGSTVFQTDGVRVYTLTIRQIYDADGGTTIYETDGVAFDRRAVGQSISLTLAEAQAAQLSLFGGETI